MEKHELSDGGGSGGGGGEITLFTSAPVVVNNGGGSYTVYTTMGQAYYSNFGNLQGGTETVIFEFNKMSVDVTSLNASGTVDLSKFGKDFIFDNNNTIGLGLGIWEPAFGAAIDATKGGGFTKAATIGVKGAGYGLVGLNVGLTTYTVVNEIQNDTFNTHSIVNISVTTIGVGLTVAGALITAPIWGTALAVTGAVLGVGYGIAQVSGIDSWIDNNWGFNNK